MPTDDLIGQARVEAKAFTRKRTDLSDQQERVGRLFAELNRRGWTFLRIEQEFGIPDNTAWRWAKPFL